MQVYLNSSINVISTFRRNLLIADLRLTQLYLDTVQLSWAKSHAYFERGNQQSWEESHGAWLKSSSLCLPAPCHNSNWKRVIGHFPIPWVILCDFIRLTHIASPCLKNQLWKKGAAGLGALYFLELSLNTLLLFLPKMEGVGGTARKLKR